MALCGAIYFLFGLFELLPIDLSVALIPFDPLGGLVMVLTGGIFLRGYVLEARGEGGTPYLYFGIGFAIFFTLVYLGIYIAGMLEHIVLKNPDYADWSLLGNIRCEMYLCVLPLIGALKWKLFRKIRRISHV